jgi:hypothetical protein
MNTRQTPALPSLLAAKLEKTKAAIFAGRENLQSMKVSGAGAIEQ